MQPWRHEDPDTSALGWLNRLARIDRHRRLTITTAYVAELRPVIAVPMGCSMDLEWGERVMVDHVAEIACFTVTPWEEDWKVEANPQAGIDLEIAEWGRSPFWRPIAYNTRLRMLELVMESMVVTLEYDCVGHSRKSDMLTEAFRAECDGRRPPPKLGPHKRVWYGSQEQFRASLTSTNRSRRRIRATLAIYHPTARSLRAVPPHDPHGVRRPRRHRRFVAGVKRCGASGYGPAVRSGGTAGRVRVLAPRRP